MSLAPPVAPLPAPPPPATAPAGVPVARRIGGIDAARAVAILGMVMVHFGPFSPDTSDPVGWLYRTSYGRASILFVLLAGIGVSLLAGDRSPQRLRRAYPKLALRVAVFLPLGLALQLLPTPVAVILQYYAMYYVVATAAVHLPDAALLAVTAAWTVSGPLVWLALNDTGPLSGAGPPSPTDLPAVLADLWVSGYYPVLTWAPPLLFGVWLGRRALREPRTWWWLVGGGVAVAAVAYGGSEVLRAALGQPDPSTPGLAWLTYAEGHRGMPLTLLGATAVGCAVLGGLLWLCDRLPRGTWPLVAAGQMALSIYVIHLLVLASWPQWLEARDAVTLAWLRVGRFFAVTLLICTLWRAVASRGPLEWLLHAPFRAAR